MGIISNVTKIGNSLVIYHFYYMALYYYWTKCHVIKSIQAFKALTIMTLLAHSVCDSVNFGISAFLVSAWIGTIYLLNVFGTFFYELTHL